MDLAIEITAHNASWLHPQTHVLSLWFFLKFSLKILAPPLFTQQMIQEFGSNPFIFTQCAQMLRYIPNEFPKPQPIHSDVSVFMDKFFNFSMLCW
jgi:hypothetical protein